MKRYRHLILGGGMVAGYAVKEMVRQGIDPGELCMISMDEDLPYQRPPLSKDFMQGEEDEAAVFINDEDFYAGNGVEVILNAWVKEADLEARTLSSRKHTLGFENLLIATGSWPRELKIPGADLDGVYYLRTLAQAKALRAAGAEASSAVIIGAGFIGMEVAASLTQLGVDCALVYREESVMEGRFTEPMARYFEDYYRERGVRLLAESTAVAIEGDGRANCVVLEDGERLAADMVVIGVGVSPETGLFEDGPLQIDDGIIANEYLETGVEGVYAAGDVVRYHDLLFDRARRFEHEDNARLQGKHVARVMLGERKPFKHVPHFYSDMFDLSWSYWGDRTLGERVTYRGEVESGEFVAWWSDEDDRVVASFTLGIPWKQGELTAKIIRARRQIRADVLADASRPIEELLE